MSLQGSSDEVKACVNFCTRCSGAMRLKLVAPSYVGSNEEMQTYFVWERQGAESSAQTAIEALTGRPSARRSSSGNVREPTSLTSSRQTNYRTSVRCGFMLDAQVRTLR